MAKFSTLSLLLSLLFVSCCIDINICSCTSTAVQMPSTVDARAAAIQYWKMKLGTNKAPPHILLSKLSALSPCEVKYFSSLHNIRKMIINDEAKVEEAVVVDAEPSNHIKMVTREEKAEVGRNSHASVQYALSSIRKKYSHVSAAINNGNFSDKDKTMATEKNNANHDLDFSNNGKIVTNEKNKKDDHATAIYNSNFSNNGKIVTSENDDHASAIYNSNFSNNGKIVTNENDDHATAIYNSNFSNNGKIVTNENDDHASAVYNSNFSNNGKMVTNENDDHEHATAIYNSNGSNITYIYDGDFSINDEIVTREKNKNDDHASAIYGSDDGHLAAIYDGNDFSNSGKVTFERNKEKQEANSTDNSKDNHVGVAHHTHESNVDVDTFFRESNLKKGKVMPMPHFKDRMPPYHFLPKSIAAKIPFSVTAIRDIFGIPANTAMGKAVEQTIAACKMPPNKDEMKRCVSAAEDMIDFVTFGLGSDNIVVKSMENSKGSGSRVLIGDAKVVNINNGKFTRTLICHQVDFPYMLHHCHTVPKTRLYEVEILDAETKQKINTGTAICHIDTSAWGTEHTAFVMLGSSPGKTEVCHWIFPWEMAWTAAAAAAAAAS